MRKPIVVATCFALLCACASNPSGPKGADGDPLSSANAGGAGRSNDSAGASNGSAGASNAGAGASNGSAGASNGSAGASNGSAGGAGASNAGAGASNAGSPGTPNGGAGSAGTALAITPNSVVLKAKATQTFTCNITCTWEIQESGGGTITAAGVYTAADAFGTYHVVAKSTVGGAAQTATATVVVPKPATGTPGVWEEVTSPNMDRSLFTGDGGFGIGSIVADPARPSDMYAGGYGSLWKSADYGLTWAEVPSKPKPPYVALGHDIAIAGTTPATLWMANDSGSKHIFKSTDGGLTFKQTGTISGLGDDVSFYSIIVDPNDSTHLITGFHEADKVGESTDGGETWRFVSGTGWPSGGKSWFPFFVDTGAASSTRKTWLAIPQDGGSLVLTTDGGQTWTKPKGSAGLTHAHGNAQLYQNGNTLFMAGIGGPGGDGVYRSTDLGVNWKLVAENSAGIVWGTPKNVYAMWGWACASCGASDGGPQFQTAAQPGDKWTMGTVPSGLDWGPNSVAVTSDGTHSIFVGSMWATGLWRYVEP